MEAENIQKEKKLKSVTISLMVIGFPDPLQDHVYFDNFACFFSSFLKLIYFKN